MRGRLIAVAGVLATSLLWAQPAATHDGHGPVFVSIAQFEYSPAEARLSTGDTVYWQWDGADRNHSVTADDGSFDSDPGKSSGISHSTSDLFQQRFDNPGTWTYHCKVHTFMRGTLRVEGTPVGQADTTPPTIDGLSVRRKRRTAFVRMTISEAVFLTIRIRRKGRTVSTHRYTPGSGPLAARISIRKLRRGRHTVLVTSKDKAGNPSQPVSATLRVP